MCRGNLEREGFDVTTTGVGRGLGRRVHGDGLC